MRKAGDLTLSYQGIPLSVGNAAKLRCNPVVDRIEKRLSPNLKYLSHGQLGCPSLSGFIILATVLHDPLQIAVISA